MAITQFNYSPGVYEAITDETLDDTPVLNTWYYFEIDSWKHVISDVVLKQSAAAIPSAAYELTIDTKYTDREVSESGFTLYAKWRIVNATYAGIATTVSGNNFGTYVDNKAMQNKLDNMAAENVTYDNTTSGLTATDTQEAIDEVVAAFPTTTSGVYARRTSSQSINHNTFTLLQINTEDKDDLVEYNNVTYTFTAIGDGWRQISASLKWGTSAVGARILTIYIDGTEREDLRVRTPSSDQVGLNISMPFYLTNGQTVKAYGFQSSGGALDALLSALSIKGYK